jgi:hypothetical protein
MTVVKQLSDSCYIIDGKLMIILGYREVACSKGSPYSPQSRSIINTRWGVVARRTDK